MVQISISTTEKRDIEGTEKKQEITPEKTIKKKKIAPAAESEEEMVHKEFLLIKPQYKNPPKLSATDKNKPRLATIKEARKFVQTWGGSPKIEKLAVYKPGKSFKLKVKLQKQFPVDPLLQMWNATHLTDTIFTVVKYQEKN